MKPRNKNCDFAISKVSWYHFKCTLSNKCSSQW